MATQTPKLGLPRPEPTDNVTLANHNALVDAIDAGAASQSELDSAKSTLTSHVNDKTNPHGVTKAQVGLGNVDNAKQATKAEFDAHVNNKSNPHGVTPAQIGAETPAGAQTKANTAEQNAINWAKSFGLGVNVPLASDLNSLPINRDTGFYMTGDTKNTPPGVNANGSVIHIARDSRPSQIFISYGTGRMYHRGYTAEGWQQWYEIWTSSGFDPSAKADKSTLDSHINNKSNPHGVTAAQIGAETPAGAQAKANTAEQNAKDASLSLANGGTVQGSITGSGTSNNFRNLNVSSGYFDVQSYGSSYGYGKMRSYYNANDRSWNLSATDGAGTAVPLKLQLSSGPYIMEGSGSPEGAISAGPGSIYLRKDNESGQKFYVKESGTGNTGWKVK